MGKLLLIAATREQPCVGSVVFVHGLGGDALGTWRHSDDDDAFWPSWLADDLKAINVYSFGYDAAPSAWLGATMPMFDRAKQLLAWLEESIPSGPMLFVCHSMGGLLVKKALQSAKDSGNEGWQKILQRTKGVVFIATPHAGSGLSDAMGRLGKVLRSTVSIEELNKSAPQLRELNEWYRNNAIRLGIATTSFYETRTIAGVVVVDASSADPGIPGAATVGLDADHLAAAKPESRSDLQHVRLKSFVERCFGPHNPSAVHPSEQGSGAGRSPTTEASVKIFISYKHGIERDRHLAEAVLEHMKALGHDVFMDVGMKVGTDWVAEIGKRLGECDFLIALLSPQAAASEMVQSEIRRAHQSRKRDNRPVILPVRVANTVPFDYELDAVLARTQKLSWNVQADTKGVLAALQRSIDAGAPSPKPSPSIKELAAPDANNPAQAVGRPTSASDPRVLLAPGGSLRATDPLYVRRDADRQIDALRNSTGQTVCIMAPRQMGKSSLLVRYLAQGKDGGKRVIWIDFQSFSEDELSSLPHLLSSLAQILARQFGVELKAGQSIANQRQFTDLVEDTFLRNSMAPVMFGLDEVDRLLGRSYQSDFFGMLRLWHNARALPASPWENVDLALVIATEPYLLIREADRSPFNVAPPIELHGFSYPELGALNAAYYAPLDADQLDDLHKLLCGHPYITRLSYYRLLSCERLSFQALIERAADDDGPFGEHLRAKLFRLQQHPPLLNAMRMLCADAAQPENEAFFRLRGAGLVVKKSGQVVPANQLYAKFFGQLR